MENWMFLFLGLLLGIPLSIFTNIATPWITSYFEKKKLSSRERRLYILVRRYKFVKKLKENPVFLNLVVFMRIIWGLIFLVLFIGLSTSIIIITILTLSENNRVIELFTAARVLGLFVLVIVTALNYQFLWRAKSDIMDVLLFEKFRHKILSGVEKLGGNPEDLDKEEAEGG